jgi:hypothetical protein
MPRFLENDSLHVEEKQPQWDTNQNAHCPANFISLGYFNYISNQNISFK